VSALRFDRWVIVPCRSMRGWWTVERNGRRVIHFPSHRQAAAWVKDYDEGLDLAA
jgi:hypothetical protein